MSVSQKRGELIRTLFPEGIPRLWCPMLVHYDGDGKIDAARMEHHLAAMCKTVRTFLLFGSTGDGWELTQPEKEELLSLCISLADRYGFQMLIGVLEPERGESARKAQEWIDWLRSHIGCSDTTDALRHAHICGFTVCAPRGQGLSQKEIAADLRLVLDLGVPTALYQLPQITMNEMTPDTVKELAEEYPNFYLFKDTSGEDRVILSGLDFGGIFFVRGAEGDYQRWSSFSGGPYPGFLLSSVNGFPADLSQVLSLLEQNETASAKALSERISSAVGDVFNHTAPLPYGNVFTNSMKCIEHIFAHGAAWDQVSPPMLHCGKRLPADMVEFAAQTLQKYGWIPEKGYL